MWEESLNEDLERAGSYSDSLWQTPECRPSPKEAKVLPQAYGTSLRLGVPSLRHSSGGIASGRLRFDLLSMCSTSSNGAARLPPDERLHSASRRGG
ncbi:hypothetical protein PS691_05837 [Pseudomonas fluorescens]|uniref:Uncharacterized protein n=1 Tax=Pseudomonas fluorescens TaxID=294 RepID=A0A5E7FTK2_PSEFL|nr:hypothetical protein PS691_05837 [Pseudomonas fluorescens]